MSNVTGDSFSGQIQTGAPLLFVLSARRDGSLQRKTERRARPSSHTGPFFHAVLSLTVGISSIKARGGRIHRAGKLTVMSS